MGLQVFLACVKPSPSVSGLDALEVVVGIPGARG